MSENDYPKPSDGDVFKWEMREESAPAKEEIPAEWLKDPKLAACVDPTSGKLFPRTKEEWGRAGLPIPDHVWMVEDMSDRSDRKKP